MFIKFLYARVIRSKVFEGKCDIFVDLSFSEVSPIMQASILKSYTKIQGFSWGIMPPSEGFMAITSLLDSMFCCRFGILFDGKFNVFCMVNFSTSLLNGVGVFYYC